MLLCCCFRGFVGLVWLAGVSGIEPQVDEVFDDVFKREAELDYKKFQVGHASRVTHLALPLSECISASTHPVLAAVSDPTVWLSSVAFFFTANFPWLMCGWCGRTFLKTIANVQLSETVEGRAQIAAEKAAKGKLMQVENGSGGNGGGGRGYPRMSGGQTCPHTKVVSGACANCGISLAGSAATAGGMMLATAAPTAPEPTYDIFKASVIPAACMPRACCMHATRAVVALRAGTCCFCGARICIFAASSLHRRCGDRKRPLE
jgi:hypothetical protein